MFEAQNFKSQLEFPFKKKSEIIIYLEDVAKIEQRYRRYPMSYHLASCLYFSSFILTLKGLRLSIAYEKLPPLI